MAKFNADHKKEMTNTYFEEGVHKIKIAGITFGKDQTNREFADFDVIGEEGQEDKARLWFHTDKAINYSFNIIRGIFVHNAQEDKKDKARELMDKVEDTEQLEKLCQTLIGKEAWFSVYKNPDRTYVNSAGETKNSFDRNITGYEPKPRTLQAVPVPPNVEGPGGEEPFPSENNTVDGF